MCCYLFSFLVLEDFEKKAAAAVEYTLSMGLLLCVCFLLLQVFYSLLMLQFHASTYFDFHSFYSGCIIHPMYKKLNYVCPARDRDSK